jgi:hypothetical protein
MVGHTTKDLFWLCVFEEEARWLSVGYAFRDRLASGPDDSCNLFADFIQRTYADDAWVPSDPRPDLVQDDRPFGALQFTVDDFTEVFCWSWMLAKVRTPMAYHLLF